MGAFYRNFDVRTTVYLLTTLFFIFAGWFGLKERVGLLAADLEHSKCLLARQQEFFKSLEKDVKQMRASIIRIEVLLEKQHTKRP